jgi:hypothetical protein
VDREPEERRKETHRQRDGAANEGREGDRRGQQVPPALDTARDPDEGTSSRQEPFPHGEERPQDGLERTWWRRIFRGPHEEPSEALGGPRSGTARGSWWRRMFGG